MAQKSISGLLRTVDEVVKMCKAEEVRINEKIHECKDILRSMKMLVKDSKETEGETNTIVKNDLLPQEKQEIELLEKVLEKALRIRTASVTQKECGTSGREVKANAHSARGDGKEGTVVITHTVKEVGKRKQLKSTLPTTSTMPRQHGKPAGSSTARGSAQKRPAASKKGPSVRPPVRENEARPRHSTTQATGADTNHRCPCAEDSSKTLTTHGPAHEESVPTTHQGPEIKHSLVSPPKEHWIPSPLLPSWRAQRSKQRWLWNKVLVGYAKPVPERSHFSERLRSTLAQFPKKWPASCPADNRRELNSLSQLCQDLFHCYRAELQANKAYRQDKEQGTGTYSEKEYESSLMLDGLERAITDVLTRARHLKRESELWDSWRSRDLCPVRRRGDWGNSACTCLPALLSYSHETELKELDRLRLRVEQLQQEIYLHQAMTEGLMPSLTTAPSFPGQPSAAGLRGLYSLLGEGGAHFPTLVLDSEPE